MRSDKKKAKNLDEAELRSILGFHSRVINHAAVYFDTQLDDLGQRGFTYIKPSQIKDKFVLFDVS